MIRAIVLVCLLSSPSALANPYPDPDRVPKDGRFRPALIPARNIDASGKEILRVQLNWEPQGEKYSVAHLVRENSGTESLFLRARKEDPLGSYKAALISKTTGKAIAHDSIGTGRMYRQLVRALTFRFPVPVEAVRLRLIAEDPETGKMTQVLETDLDLSKAELLKTQKVAARLLRSAQASPRLVLSVYADGYLAKDEALFFTHAARVSQVLDQYAFPMREHFEIRAVFAPSTLELGRADDLGLPVAERDSFLGLYHPYWHPFGRWYHVVYPTREKRYRDGLAQVAYDYPLVLLNSSEYWGVGNYRELTAIPARHGSFGYLLAHEFGHFFGLNEEYEGGGPTELEFAPGIEEPWSPNITFLRSKDHGDLKWNRHVEGVTPLPTPADYWKRGKFGAYPGGYADSEPRSQSHKPGWGCVMSITRAFCPICQDGVREVLRRDLGISAP